MKIVIDCRSFIKQATGIATFELDAIKAMLNYLPDWELFLLSPKPFHNSIQDLVSDRIHIIICPVRYIKIPNQIWYFFKFPIVARKLNPAIMWCPRPDLPLLPLSIKKMITIHDVVAIEYYKTTSLKEKIGSIPFLRRAVKTSDLIWCNSNYTKEKVEFYFPERKCKNFIVGDACSTEFKKLKISEERKKELRKKYKVNNKFLLFVGTIEPRKNLKFLLELMPAIYQESGTRLLVIGAKGWSNSDLFHLINNSIEIQKAVEFAGYITQYELIELYNTATCFVSTSINEGFGMPQLEAMRCGCPVISPHNSAMIEVVHGRGLTIKGWEHSVWINNILSVLENPSSFVADRSLLSSYDWESIIKAVYNYVNK